MVIQVSQCTKSSSAEVKCQPAKQIEKFLEDGITIELRAVENRVDLRGRKQEWVPKDSHLK